MTELLLGIDLGTSGAKVGLYTPEGRLLGLGRSAAYAASSPRPDWSECDPEAWWVAVVQSLAGACRDARVDPELISGVGLSVFFPAVVAFDASLRALRPAILYNDRRSVEQAARITEVFAPGEFARLSGNGASPGTCAATSILWLKERERSVYDETAVFGFANTFLTARLAGARATDLTHAGLSGLVDIRFPERWEASICRVLGIDPERLPAILPAASVVGEVTAAAAASTGLRAGIPVVCGCGDAPCGSFGAGSIEPGSVAYVAGSTDCVTTPLAAPLEDHRWLTMGYVRPGLWLGIGTMTSAGAAVDWFVDTFYAGDRSDRWAAMAAEAEAAPAGDVMFLPYLQGERTPVWDPCARGLFTSLTLSTTRADMARAVYEGTALGLRDVVACLEEREGGAVSEIRATGGPMRNAFWTQMKADVLGRPLEVLDLSEAGSLGAALLAATARGHYASLEEAARAVRRIVPTTVVEPGPGAARNSERYARYRELYPRTREVMHALAAGGGA